MRAITRREVLAVAAGCAAAVRVTASPIRKKIRAAILGIGHFHAAGKTEILQSCKDFELAGVCEPNEELRRQTGSQPPYQDVRWLSLPELLADKSIQLVAVESRVQENLDYARSAVEAGKHVHLDKPPGSDLEKLRSLLDEAARRRVTVQMGYMWRYNKGIELALEAARKGWLGKVYLVRGSISSDLDRSTRLTLASSPGGMMFELGSHLIDLAVDLLGRPLRVTPFLRHDGPEPDGVVDHTLAVLEYEGALVEVHTSALQPSGGEHRFFEVQGTNGTVKVEPLEPPVLDVDLKSAAGPYRSKRQKFDLKTPPRYLSDFQELAAIIRGEQQPKFSPQHDLMTQETLLRACAVLSGTLAPSKGGHLAVRVLKLSDATSFQMGKVNARRVVHPSMGARNLTLNYVVSEPGDEFPQHVHDHSDDVFLVLQGQIDVRQGDSRRPLLTGQAALVPAGQIHGSVTTGSGTAIVISFQSPPDAVLYTGARDSSRPGAAPPKGVITPGAVKQVDFPSQNGFFIHPGMGSRRLAVAYRRLSPGEKFKSSLKNESEQLVFVWKGSVSARAANAEHTLGEKETAFISGKGEFEVRNLSPGESVVVQVQSPVSL